MASSLNNSSAKDAFESARNEYRQTKQRLAYWIGLLNGNVTLPQGINILESVNISIANLQNYILVPGFTVYAQSAYVDATFDPIVVINTMIADLQAISTWITLNIPNTTYTPAQTAPLLALIQAAQTDAV